MCCLWFSLCVLVIYVVCGIFDVLVFCAVCDYGVLGFVLFLVFLGWWPDAFNL